MSKSRSINSGIRLDEDFAELSYRQRDLWHGILALADDQGRLPGHPGAVRSLVWPYDEVGIEDVRNDLMVLANEQHGYIHVYEVHGKSFIQIINWWKYQSMQWAGKSNFPAPEGWNDRLRYHGKGHVVQTVNWDEPGGFYQRIAPVKVNDNEEVNVNVKVKPNFKGRKPPSNNNQNEPADPIPANLNTDKFRATWGEWVGYRKEIKHKLTDTTVSLQLKKLAKYPEGVAVQMLEQSMENGWTGIFELKNNNGNAKVDDLAGLREAMEDIP